MLKWSKNYSHTVDFAKTIYELGGENEGKELSQNNRYIIKKVIYERKKLSSKPE